MRQNNKAHSTMGVVEQAKETAALQGACHFCTNFNSEPPRRQSWQIADFLGCGEQNAVKSDELRVICSLPTMRALRQQVHNERLNGVPILSGTAGYYLPSPQPQQAREEILAFVRTMRAKGISLLHIADTVEARTPEIDGQTTLEVYDYGKER